MKTESKKTDASAAGKTFAIVVSRWHDDFTSKLADAAVTALKSVGADDVEIDVFYVPGAFELPVACRKAAKSGEYDAVIALGVVIRGDTPHFDYVAGQTASGLMDAAMRTGVPVMFGVITADNLEQVVERSGDGPDNKGWEAAMAAVETVRTLNAIRMKAEERWDVRREKLIKNVN